MIQGGLKHRYRLTSLTLLVFACSVSACARDQKMVWPAATTANPTSFTIPRTQPAAPRRVTKSASTVQAVAIENDVPPSLAWPMEPRAITSRFGVRHDPLEPDQTRFHRGVDMSGHYGAMVRAAASGRISEGGWKGNAGRHVRVEHTGGMVTSYSHLSLILVSPGMWVEQGDPIGLVGESGRATGPHLHFEVLAEGVALDPLMLLGDMPDRDMRLTSTR